MGFSIFRFQRCGACFVRQAVSRQYSGRRSFIQDFISKVKEEYQQDKDMKANLKKFREETEKLEKSEEIQKVRQYYKKIEKEIRTDTSDKLRDAVSSAKDRVTEELDDIRKQEYVRKGLEGVSKVTESVSKTAQTISEADIMKKAKEGVKAVEEELDSERRKMYQAPERLKTRYELAGKIDKRVIEADDEAMGMVLHKDSKWYAAWSDFKDNNQYMQKFFDMKTKYDESDNLMIRSTRFVTDRVSQLFGGVFSNSEMTDVLTEITKIDSSFSVEEFLRFCRFEIIPNVLEAMIRGDLKILEDWCHEAPFNVLAQPLRQAQELKCQQDSKILDVQHVDVSSGKMMEQGPVLVITFNAQQINVVRNMKGDVVEGDPNKILRVTHVWALCRDQEELNPWAAWRILDLAMAPAEQWL